MCNCETGGRHQHGHHNHHGGHCCECRSEREHRAGRECGCGCGAERDAHGMGCHDGGHHGFRRSYRSKAEVIAELEAYLAELKAEALAVEEHLNELRD
jgi:hypothetical protein